MLSSLASLSKKFEPGAESAIIRFALNMSNAYRARREIKPFCRGVSPCQAVLGLRNDPALFDLKIGVVRGALGLEHVPKKMVNHLKRADISRKEVVRKTTRDNPSHADWEAQWNRAEYTCRPTIMGAVRRQTPFLQPAWAMSREDIYGQVLTNVMPSIRHVYPFANNLGGVLNKRGFGAVQNLINTLTAEKNTKTEIDGASVIMEELPENLSDHEGMSYSPDEEFPNLKILLQLCNGHTPDEMLDLMRREFGTDDIEELSDDQVRRFFVMVGRRCELPQSVLVL